MRTELMPLPATGPETGPESPAARVCCSPAKPPIAVLGVPIDDVSAEEAVELIGRMMLSGEPHYFATANVDFLVQAQRDPELHRILLDAELVVCDGSPVLWASRLLGKPLRERVAGADLVPLLLRVAAQHGLRVFLLGAAPESASRAAVRIAQEYPGLVLAGHYSPPFAPLLDMDHGAIAARIGEARPDLLLVAFGCPKQEKWIAMHYRALGVPVSAGVGASFDFLSGHMRRAPLWLQRVGLEWAFRLLQEPRRLFARYAKDFRVFGRQLLRQYTGLKAQSSQGDAPPPAPVLADKDGLQWIGWPARLDAASVSRQSAAELIADGRNCAIDLAKVEAVDSSGVGFLIGLRRALRLQNSELVLIAPSAAVVRALRLMRLDKIFPTAPDLNAARGLIEERRQFRAEPVSERVGPHGAITWRGEVSAENVAAVRSSTETRLERRAQARNRVWIDLSDLQFVDSAGLLLMKRLQASAQQRGMPLAFRNPSPTIRQIARLAGAERSLFD